MASTSLGICSPCLLAVKPVSQVYLEPVDTTCSLEGCTLGHLLSSCSKTLERFKFRHRSLRPARPDHQAQEARRLRVGDLTGWRVSGGTVPPELVLTDQIPNLVIVDRSTIPTRVVLVELTVPWDTSTSFQAAFDRKTARYERLEEDLRLEGYTSSNLPLDVRSLAKI